MTRALKPEYFKGHTILFQRVAGATWAYVPKSGIKIKASKKQDALELIQRIINRRVFL